MKANRRIYSLPYNGTNPQWFLQEAEKRKKNIDHVYCELPFDESEMLSHVRFTFDGKNGENMDIAPLAETLRRVCGHLQNCRQEH